jgi:hypothetical protein
MFKILSFQQAYDQLENEVISIGQLPANEDPNAIIGTNDALEMCSAYIQQLIRTHGRPPKGCEYFILQTLESTKTKKCYEAAISYPLNSPNAVKYALNVECGDLYWDATSIAQLENPKLGLRIIKK